MSDKIEAIEQIFKLKHLHRNHNKQKAGFKTNRPRRSADTHKRSTYDAKSSGLIGREKLEDPDAEADILKFVHDFITHVVERLRNTMCFVVVLDGAVLLNAPSWTLFNLMASSPLYMVLVMCL